MHDELCFRGIFLEITILHYVVGSSHHCTGHVNTHCP
jgi:hypothetical protein